MKEYNTEEIRKIEEDVRNQEKEEGLPENIPTITKAMIALSTVNLTKAWTRLDIGCIMRKKDTDDTNKQCYIFLGLVDEQHIPDDDLLDVISSEIISSTRHRRHLGWFAEFPTRPEHIGYESETKIYMWYVDLFEKVDLAEIPNE